MQSRRTLIQSILWSASLLALGCKQSAHVAPKNLGTENDDGLEIKKITKTNAEWKELLSREQYHILREEGTEAPRSSPLNTEKRKGEFVCAGCSLPLFKSTDKYESGTGWPSFTKPIPGALETKEDRKLFVSRTEYHCIRCGGHQGHVFNDGPAPEGTRYCNNGAALLFKKSNNL